MRRICEISRNKLVRGRVPGGTNVGSVVYISNLKVPVGPPDLTMSCVNTLKSRRSSFSHYRLLTIDNCSLLAPDRAD